MIDNLPRADALHCPCDTCIEQFRQALSEVGVYLELPEAIVARRRIADLTDQYVAA